MEITISTYTRNGRLYILGKDIPAEVIHPKYVNANEEYPVYIKFYNNLDRTSPQWRKSLKRDGNVFDFETTVENVKFGLWYNELTLTITLEEEVYAETW